MNPRAPLYTDAYDLVVWLLNHLDERQDGLSRETCRTGLELLDHVVFALKTSERWEHLADADGALLKLRQRIRLIEGRGIFDERQALHALSLCERIGRQIGGWQRSLAQSQ